MRIQLILVLTIPRLISHNLGKNFQFLCILHPCVYVHVFFCGGWGAHVLEYKSVCGPEVDSDVENGNHLTLKRISVKPRAPQFDFLLASFL